MLAESVRPEPDETVADWLKAQPGDARGIVTRKLSDFRECGLPLINPWKRDER